MSYKLKPRVRSFKHHVLASLRRRIKEDTRLTDEERLELLSLVDEEDELL